MLEPSEFGANTALDLPAFDDGDDFQVQPLPRPGGDGPGGPWWRQRRWQMVIGGVLAVLLLAGIGTAALAARRQRIAYATARVSEGTLTLSVSASGPVRGTIYAVNFAGSGKLSEIDVSVGQQVTAGQLLAKLDPTSLGDAVNQAQAAVDAAQTAVGDANTNQSAMNAQTAAEVQTAYDQEQAALAKCGSSASCQQQAQDQYAQAQAQAQTQNDQAQAQVNSAQAQLTSAQAQLTTAQDNANNATLSAPHAGTIAAINGVVGGTPGAGGSASAGASSASATGTSGNTFIQIADLSALQVEADVNEADIGGLALNDAAQFTVSAYPNLTFKGTVSAIAPLGQTTSNVVTYPVTLTVDMTALQGAHLLPGMTATISITTLTRAGVLLVPASAVAFARTATATSTGLFTAAQVRAANDQAQQALTQLQSLDPNSAQDTPTATLLVVLVKGRPALRPVVLGLTDGSQYELLTGLSLNDAIVRGATGGPFGTTSSSSGSTPGFRFGGGGGLGGGG